MPYFGRYGVKAYLREVDSWLHPYQHNINTASDYECYMLNFFITIA